MVDGWRDPAEALAGYEPGLPLSERTRREYARWVRLFCGWLRDGIDERAVGADPLADPRARDYATRDFKRFLKTERMLGPASVNLALAAVDHLYRHLGMDRANVRRERLAQTAPRALSREEQRPLLRAAERAEPRDRALVVVLLFAGLRISEAVALDLDDLRVSSRKGTVIVRSASATPTGRCRSTRSCAQRSQSGSNAGPRSPTRRRRHCSSAVADDGCRHARRTRRSGGSRTTPALRCRRTGCGTRA